MTFAQPPQPTTHFQAQPVEKYQGEPAQGANTVSNTDQLILSWQARLQQRNEATEAEMSLRKQVSEAFFPTPKKGTQRHSLGKGWNLKLVYKENPKLGDADKVDEENNPVSIADQVADVEDQIEALGEEAKFLVERLIKWSPSLSESEYKKLDLSRPLNREIKALIDRILTFTPAAPSLELEPPKPEK